MIIENLADKTINVFLLMLDDWINSIDLNTIFEHFITLYDIFLDILAYVYFFLPVSYLIPLIYLVFSVLVTRICISFFRLVVNIIDGIPLIG